MARIVLASYLIRYPVGGYQSWILQWLVGLQQLGHDVFFVEKAGWDGSCFDLVADAQGNDPSRGIAAVRTLLERFGLERHWCFVDWSGRYLGMTESQVREVFATADVYIDTMQHCEWPDEAMTAGLRVLVDGEPGMRQMRLQRRAAENLPVFPYDHFYTVGRNVGTPASTVPVAGRIWRPIFDPVVVDLFPAGPPPPDARWTTVMSWQAHAPIEYGGVVYGQKDMEFEQFIDLPARTAAGFELAVRGANTPLERLTHAGWHVRDAHQATSTFDAWREYIASSRGEFSVAKHIFVRTHSGFFSDRSAAYLASGRPVVLQETGFSRHLPCGHGLFAVRDVEEAAAAIDEVEGHYSHHSAAARELAREHLDASRVLSVFLSELGL